METPLGTFWVDYTFEDKTGWFRDSDGHEFCVDSGAVGLVPWALCLAFEDGEEVAEDFGRLVESDDPVTFETGGGTFVVTHGNVTIKLFTD